MQNRQQHYMQQPEITMSKPIISPSTPSLAELMKIAKNSKSNKRKRSKKGSKILEPIEVPIFLRKTYFMVDTCDLKIASWSDDGESFVENKN
mmetsp:Transcript_62320/g.72887  ORF Transcript_62320/g.72887 Transcript_62320/m.72887 type:complete len:92 (-) Transcript_62320:1203-1478(-)